VEVGEPGVPPPWSMIFKGGFSVDFKTFPQQMGGGLVVFPTCGFRPPKKNATKRVTFFFSKISVFVSGFPPSSFFFPKSNFWVFPPDFKKPPVFLFPKTPPGLLKVLGGAPFSRVEGFFGVPFCLGGTWLFLGGGGGGGLGGWEGLLGCCAVLCPLVFFFFVLGLVREPPPPPPWFFFLLLFFEPQKGLTPFLFLSFFEVCALTKIVFTAWVPPPPTPCGSWFGGWGGAFLFVFLFVRVFPSSGATELPPGGCFKG